MLKRLLFLLAILFMIPVAEAGHQGIDIEIHAPTTYETNRLTDLTNKLNFDGQTMPRWWRVIVLRKPEWDGKMLEYGLVGKTDSAFTILGDDVTFLNEDYLSLASDEQLEHTLAHESGHLICNCSNEDTANKIAEKLENKPSRGSDNPGTADSR